MAGGFKVFRFSITHTALVYAAVLIFSTGGGLPQPGLPFFATETLHATTAGLGVLSIATASGLLLSSILGGYISDKIGRPPVIIACFLVDGQSVCRIILVIRSKIYSMLRSIASSLTNNGNACDSEVSYGFYKCGPEHVRSFHGGHPIA